MTSQASTPSNALGRAPVYRLIDPKDAATKTLGNLLRQNHASHAVLREPRLLFHNHVPHALGSSYLLGASSAKLEEIYASDAPNLTVIDVGVLRNAITRENWREYLGQKKYTAAYVDYFDSEVEKNGGNWNKVVEDHLYSGTKMLINGFSGGLGHPFIHLAYGYEFDCKEVVTEALSLGCTEYDQTHKYLDSSPPDNSTYKTTSLADVLEKLHSDHRFDGYSEHLGFANIFTLLGKFESEVLEHWNALVVEDATTQLKDWLQTAATLAVSAVNAEGGLDFYLAHVLTVGHALRILLPLMPEQHRISVMKQYGLYTILVYLAQLRPSFGPDAIKSFKAEHLSWDAINKSALESKWSNDVHWPKVVRALKVVEDLRGSEDGYYKLAAVKFLAEFDGWTGFGLGVDAIH
ncbi:MGS207 protein [Dactylonectria estremocensis]|uniref:MGS207 protein n=1 Tax=Dactylonectria estremocensis TaxID=1079267 RepID=A0A9P9ERU0_9HYPO|nr:MGS207 protein [Dactylonectria estremocensis]